MGWMSPSLNFATSIGSAITGAAKQFNENTARDDAQKQQDEKIWIAKFADSMKSYEADTDKKKDTNFVFQQLKNALNGNESAADQGVAQWIANGRKGDLSEIIKRLSPSPAADPAYKAVTPSMLDDSLNRKYQNLNSMRNGMRPQMQKLFPQPIAPTQMGYAEGGMADDDLPQDPMNSAAGAMPQEAVPQPTSFDLSGTTTTANAPGVQVAQAPGYNAVWNHDIGKDQNALIKDMFDKLSAQGFDSVESIKKFHQSVEKNPKSPSLWDTSGILPPQSKLPPEIAKSYGEQIKRGAPLMSPESRQQFDVGMREAARTGDVTKIRNDLLPSEDQLIEHEALTKGAVAGTQAYVKRLEKRAETISANNSLFAASDKIINMATNNYATMRASALQPLMDNINRVAGAGGIDLTAFGFPANRIEDVNMFKKLLGDMTFQQISQYHLGRWTNYEVGLLRDKLPSLETDPNAMVKVALIFRSSAKREMEMYRKEHAMTYGPNGGIVPRGTGKARQYAADQVDQDNAAQESGTPGVRPYESLDDYFGGSVKADSERYVNAPDGTWFEDKKTGAMIQKGKGFIPPVAPMKQP